MYLIYIICLEAAVADASGSPSFRSELAMHTIIAQSIPNDSLNHQSPVCVCVCVCACVCVLCVCVCVCVCVHVWLCVIGYVCVGRERTGEREYVCSGM